MIACAACGRPATAHHHAVYQQELRRIARGPAEFRAFRSDTRGFVACCDLCHNAHHARQSPFLLSVLGEEVFVFAEQIMGAGCAFEYLRRRYAGVDPRLDALLDHVTEEAA